MALTIPLDNLQSNKTILQRNTIKHTLNHFQKCRFVTSYNCDAIIYTEDHHRVKKNDSQFVQNESLFVIQDGENGGIRSDLLYICKEMPVGLLTNTCTSLHIVNGAQAIVFRIVPHLNSKIFYLYLSI